VHAGAGVSVKPDSQTHQTIISASLSINVASVSADPDSQTHQTVISTLLSINVATVSAHRAELLSIPSVGL